MMAELTEGTKLSFLVDTGVEISVILTDFAVINLLYKFTMQDA